MMPNEDDIRSTIESAMTAAETPEQPPQTTTDEVTTDQPEQTQAPEPKEVETPVTEIDSKGRERDASGRFKGKEKSEGTEPTPPVLAHEETQTQLPKSKAPGSWRPTAREKWAALDPEVQQEILRRERDIANGFNEVGGVKKFKEDVDRTLAPYQHIIAAEGGQPLAVMNNLFATAAALYNGSPMQKATTVAAMIRNFGVDVATIDEILSGQTPTGQPRQTNTPDIANLVRAELQSALAPILQDRQAQEQELVQSLEQQLQDFAEDPKNEFFSDVKDTMADVLELAGRRGEKLDLQSAYNRAILMHSEIAEVVQERALREKAAAASAAAAAARKKAVSVTGAPAKEIAGGTDGSLKGDILSAIDTLS